MFGEINPVSHAERVPPDWNVTVTLSEPTFRIARKLLARWGQLRRTEHHNVAVMAVADPASFLQEFAAAVGESPGILNAMSHVVAFDHVFAFANTAEFEAKSREIALSYVPQLSVVNSLIRPAGLAPAWQPASPAHTGSMQSK